MSERKLAEAVFERMGAYASDLERASPPVFVGREDELDALQFALKRVAADNPRGMARVVQGVAGAGKSSLCDEFMASVQGQQTGGGKRALCAKIFPSDLDAPPLRFVAALNEELLRTQTKLPGAQGHFAAGRRHARQLASTAVQLGFKSSEYRINDETHGLTEASPLTTCINVYADHMWPDDVAIVLSFDEMQNCPITDRSAHAFQILNERVHDGCIFVVCFGLQNTAAVIREGLKLSRMSNDAVMEICTLRRGEGRQVLERTLDYFGATADNDEWLRYVRSAGFGRHYPWPKWRQALIDDLEARSGDFPQHLTAALRSVCLALGRNRDSFSPENDLLTDIAELHETNKSGYYDQRMGADLRLHRTALGAVVRAADNDARGIPLRDAVAAFEAGDDLGRRVNGDSAFELVDLAVTRGVLRQSEVQDELRCEPPPLPSMTTHLRARFDRQLARGDKLAIALAKHFGFEPLGIAPESV